MKDTDSIDSRDLEVVNQLDNSFSVGVRRVTVSHLNTNRFVRWVLKICFNQYHHVADVGDPEEIQN